MSEFSDEELIMRAVRVARSSVYRIGAGFPNWWAVNFAFALNDEGQARSICQRAGIDPDAAVV